MEFLEIVLVRNPDLRPTAPHMERMFDTLLGVYTLEDKLLGFLGPNILEDEYKKKKRIHASVEISIKNNKVLKSEQIEYLSSRDLYHYIVTIF